VANLLKPRIFIGLTDISSQIQDLSEAFKLLGYQTITAVYQKRSVVNDTRPDYDIQEMNSRQWFANIRPYRLRLWLQKKLDAKNRVWQKAIRKCDVFIFLWDTFQPDFSDLALLKSLGKKVVTIHVGDDVRWVYAMQQEFASYHFQPMQYDSSYFHWSSLHNKLNRLRYAEKYADLVYSRLDQAQLSLRPYHQWKMMVRPEKFTAYSNQKLQNPLVIHSPTNREIKGTQYILEAVERLKSEGFVFEFQLFENIPHQEALQLYQKADIVIDQLLCPGAGKFATECLAMGKVVLAKMGYGVYPQKIAPNCPLVDVNPENIYQVLKDLLPNHARRQALAEAGPLFVKEHLNFHHFCKDLLEKLTSSPDTLTYDYYPSFFRQQFVPESAEALQSYNQWTAFVKDCDWYKQYVPTGERDGLIF
jgi:hypothetical protein